MASVDWTLGINYSRNSVEPVLIGVKYSFVVDTVWSQCRLEFMAQSQCGANDDWFPNSH